LIPYAGKAYLWVLLDEVRTAEQGADTAIWLGLVPAVGKDLNGQFIQGRADLGELDAVT
jgi:hypothetical protein